MDISQSSVEHTASDYGLQNGVPKEGHASVLYSHDMHQAAFG